MDKLEQQTITKTNASIEISYESLIGAGGTVSVPKWNLTHDQFLQCQKTFQKYKFGLTSLDITMHMGNSIFSGIWTKGKAGDFGLAQAPYAAFPDLFRDLLNSNRFPSLVVGHSENNSVNYYVSWDRQPSNNSQYVAVYVHMDDATYRHKLSELSANNYALINQHQYDYMGERYFNGIWMSTLSMWGYSNWMTIQNAIAWKDGLINYGMIPMRLQAHAGRTDLECFGIAQGGVTNVNGWYIGIGMNGQDLSQFHDNYKKQGLVIRDLSSYSYGQSLWYNAIWVNYK